MNAEQQQNDKTAFLDLLRILWQDRRTIFAFIAIGAVVGLVLAFTLPNEYRVVARLMPEYTTESQGGASSLLRQFGGLAGLAGASYNANSNAIQVVLYPEIVQTLPFQKQLMNHKFQFSLADSSVSLYDYFLERHRPGIGSFIIEWSVGLPGKFLALFRSEIEPISYEIYLLNGVVLLDRNQFFVARILQKRVTATLDIKSGIIAITVNLPDPVLTANVGQYVIEQLTAYLVQYRTEKLQRDLTFTEERLTEARERYESAGFAYSAFRESAQGTPTSRARQGEQFLQSEYELAFGVYNNLTQQLEQQKLKLQEETPMFKILQPVYLPDQPVSPNKLLISIFFIATGGLFSLILLYLRRLNILSVFAKA